MDRFALAALILAMPCLALAAESMERLEAVPLKFIVNFMDKGDFLVEWSTSGDVVVPQDMLASLDVRLPPGAQGAIHDGKVSLRDLAPSITFTIDRDNGVVMISADPSLLSATTLGGSSSGPPIQYEELNSAFLNYNLNVSLGNRFDFQSLSLPLEAVARLHGWNIVSDFSYSKTDISDSLIRNSSFLVQEDPNSMRRLTLGDLGFFSGGGWLQGNSAGSASLGGIQISKNFALQPGIVLFPDLDVSTLLDTPSDVTIYVNGRLLEEKKGLPAGALKYSDLPLAFGYNDVLLVIWDVHGQEKRVHFHYLKSPQRLKPGLQEYSYSLGFERKSQDFFDYGKLAFIGSHRVGVSKSVTAGYRVSASEHLASLEADGAFALGGPFEFLMGVGGERSHGHSGLGGIGNLAFSGKRVGVNWIVEGYSRDYFDASVFRKTKLASTLHIGLNTDVLGGLSAEISIARMHEGNDSHRMSLSYSRTLSSYAFCYASLSRTEEEARVSHEGSLNLSFRLGSNRSAELGFSSQSGSSSTVASVSQGTSSKIGLQYSLQARRQELANNTSATSASLSVDYLGKNARLSFSSTQGSGQESYQFGLAGALAFADNAFFATRPIAGSFALVDVGNIPGADVLLGSYRMGLSNRKGKVFVPDVVSYQLSTVSIDLANLPLDYEVSEKQKQFVAPFLGGALVKFDGKKLRAFTGTVHILKNGAETPIENAGLEIQTENGKISSSIGLNGEFYLDNIVPGKYQTNVFFQNQTTCKFTLSIPQGTESIVDFGIIICH